jgi:hypothetical protein
VCVSVFSPSLSLTSSAISLRPSPLASPHPFTSGAHHFNPLSFPRPPSSKPAHRRPSMASKSGRSGSCLSGRGVGSTIPPPRQDSRNRSSPQLLRVLEGGALKRMLQSLPIRIKTPAQHNAGSEISVQFPARVLVQYARTYTHACSESAHTYMRADTRIYLRMERQLAHISI